MIFRRKKKQVIQEVVKQEAPVFLDLASNLELMNEMQVRYSSFLLIRFDGKTTRVTGGFKVSSGAEFELIANSALSAIDEIAKDLGIGESE